MMSLLVAAAVQVVHIHADFCLETALVEWHSTVTKSIAIERRWARASYIQRLVEPIRTSERSYYEDWLGRLDDETTTKGVEPGKFEDCGTCYSINGNSSGYGISYLPWDLGPDFYGKHRFS